ncbi:MAG: hypothetical protein M1820_008743 [Bogoriella megaspora]|nr:MAG: hypothetical protein M1820_008743 [Bogoriella megaspora]
MSPARIENDIIEDFRQYTDPQRPRRDIWCPDSDFEKSEELDFFVPEVQLRKYFERHLDEILSTLSEETGLRFVEPRLILDGYIKIFATLLRINREAWINYFLNLPSLSDNKLPFEGRPHDFPAVEEEDRFFWTSFNKCQWIFCAPELKYKPRCKWNTQTVLPIIFKERIGSGSHADTFKIRIHPDYNHLRKSSAYRGEDRDIFVLKTFRRKACKLYRREAEAYAKIRRSFDGRNENGIIGFYGSFEHREAFHIILEHANCDTLQDYMNSVPPPMKTEDILSFWENLLVLTRALEGLHAAVHHESANVTEKGWHQDIKPTNILCQLEDDQSPYQCAFKLADLGLSHFLLDVQESNKPPDNRGLRAYGAPEGFKVDGVNGQYSRYVSQKVDVWSLGCILAEAAVWVVTGQLGLEEFRNQRAEMSTALQDLGCFHDGMKVLALVDQTLKDMVAYRRVSDPITEGLIPLILKMLWRESSRPYARELWIEARGILETSRPASFAPPQSPRSMDSISFVPPLEPSSSDKLSSRGHPEWREISYDFNGRNGISRRQSPHTSRPSIGDGQRSPPSLPTSSPSSVTELDIRSPRAFESDPDVIQKAPDFSFSRRRPTMEANRPGGLDRAIMSSPERDSLFSIIQQTPPDMRALERLLEFGVDVDERNENGQTPIMVAADNGDFRVVRMLLGRARLDIQDKLGQTLLHQIPKKNGGDNMLEMILSHARVHNRPIDINAAGISGRTPLHEAVRIGKTKAIRLLIEHGANVNIRDNRRTLPSTVAIEGDKVMALECLLKYDCELDAEKLNPKEVSKDIKWMLKRHQKLPKKKWI